MTLPRPSRNWMPLGVACFCLLINSCVVDYANDRFEFLLKTQKFGNTFTTAETPYVLPIVLSGPAPFEGTAQVQVVDAYGVPVTDVTYPISITANQAWGEVVGLPA